MSVILNIVSEFDSKGIKLAQRQFQQLEKTSDKVAFAMKRSMVPATAALTTLAAVAFKATKMASDLNEETSKAQQIFGDASDSIIAFSDTAASKLGQSKTEALKAAGTFGVLGKAAGLTGNDLTAMSIQFTKLASDLASFNNTSPEDAVLALGAGLRGEAEPLRRYGVLLDDATLRQKALDLELVKSTKEALTPQNKSLAAQAVILEKTALQQGNFALTAKDAANSQRTFTAKLKDLQTQMGVLFLPVLKETLDTLNDYADVLIYLTSNTDKAKDSTGKWLDRFIKLATIVLPFAQVMKGLGIVVGKVNEYVGNQASALKQNERATSRVTNKIQELAGFEKLLQTKVDDTTKSTDKSTAAAKKKADALAKAKEAAAKLKAEIQDLADALRARLNVRLEDAQEKLKDAQDAFDNFGKSVGAAVTSSFNFGNAQSEASGNAADLQKALDKQSDAQDKVNEAYNKWNAFQDKDNYDALVLVQKDLAAATLDVAAAQAKPMTFFDNLSKQADKAKKFGELVSRLMAGNLNEAALQQVLAAGVDGGTLIAEEILGSADGILRANKLTDGMTQLAKDMAKKSAAKYYQAGVDAATSFLDGIKDTIAKVEVELSKPNLSKTDIYRAGVIAGEGIDLSNFDFSGLDLSGIFANIGGPGVGFGMGTLMAEGGVVTRATSIIAGEAGPEAIIPLDRLGSMGGGMNITVQAGIVSTPDQIGQEIISAILKSQRKSGAVFAPATGISF
jgi:hypothetical protein